jgi:CheY-like chemotaxis protein
MNILIADDDAAIRHLVALVAQSEGHEAVCTADGEEAISALHASPSRFDVIVTDLVMPVMDGHELVRRARRECPGLKIVCISGYSDVDPPADTVFLSKPFTILALKDALTAAIGTRRAELMPKSAA